MKVKMKIPKYVQDVAKILLESGFQCYLIGGALRDIVYGKQHYEIGRASCRERV